MTYIQKYMELHPNDNPTLIKTVYCPTKFFENAGLLCEEVVGHRTVEDKCFPCWDHEYQGEEVK